MKFRRHLFKKIEQMLCLTSGINKQMLLVLYSMHMKMFCKCG